MSHATVLRPHDSAWRRFEARELGKGGFSQDELFLSALERAAPLHDLGEPMVHVAAEIVGVEQGLEPAAWRGLLALVVASLVWTRQGSTRIPIEGQLADARLRELFKSLARYAEPLEADRDVVDELMDSIKTIISSRGAPSLIGSDANAYTPFIHISPYLYPQHLLGLERSTASTVATLLARPIAFEGDEGTDAVRDALIDILDRRPGSLELSDEQQMAVAVAARAPLAVLTGGPGTGKTSIVVGILRVLVRLGVRPDQIALAAPTGRAAYRLGEAVRASLGAIATPTEHDKALIDAHLEPQTLHRLLGYSQREGRYRHHVNHRLEPKVVILDEGSMIDLNLMGRLVQALADDARLVLLGDADQLPSVDAGAVLRDLVDADERARGAQVQQLALQGVSSPDEVARSAAEMRVVRLTHSYRMSPKDPMGRAILTAARLVNAGDPTQLFDHAIDGRIVVEAREHATELKFQGVEWVPPGAKEKAALLEKWIAEKITGLSEFRALATRVYRRGPDGFKPDDADALDRLTKHLASARILCATRVFSGGADTLNRLMHGRMLLHMDRTTDPGFIAGEPVLVERNDYDRKLFNGDQGVVVMAADGDAPAELTVVFRRDQRFDAFRLAGMQQDLSLAYAMTVHKAQGSEFDDVVFVLPDQNMPILTRELLYTAMTRSRRSVTLVGSRELVESSVAAKMARFSGLADGIERNLASSGITPTPSPVAVTPRRSRARRR